MTLTDQGGTRLPIYPEPPDPAALGVELRLGWLKGDATLEADAKAFWKACDVLPTDEAAEKRAPQILLAAYAGERLVAVSTAAIRETPYLRCKMALYRCAVDPEYRGQMMSVMITAHSFKVLEDWSLAHPDEGVMGVMAVMQNEKYQRKTHPHRPPETRLSLAFFNDRNQKVCVGWFDHARL
ncbi:MAG TPA: hypothetical protein VG407_03155 [Caulobacteraceae bacterium]|nr:hypothetical protein [Caulobacteraceae bacterium]